MQTEGRNMKMHLQRKVEKLQMIRHSDTEITKKVNT
jgi:hypothetical protein